MQVLHREDMKTLKMYINEFIVSSEIDQKENFLSDFLIFLRKNEVKIEDGQLLNELYDLIEKKLI